MSQYQIFCMTLIYFIKAGQGRRRVRIIEFLHCSIYTYIRSWDARYQFKILKTHADAAQSLQKKKIIVYHDERIQQLV